MTTPPYRRPVSCKYGAPMGRPATKPEPDSPPCRLRRVHLRQGYDDGGAYWGEPNTLWCLYTDCGGVEVYVRGEQGTRQSAITKLKTLYPFLKLQRN